MSSIEKIKDMEQESTKEMYEAMTDMIKFQREVFKNPDSEEERNVSEAKLKSYAKILNEMKSCEDHSYMDDKIKLENRKLDEASKEAKKTRKWDIGKTIINGGLTLWITVYTAISARKNMVVCEDWEKLHYASTTAQKKAIEMCCDLAGCVHRTLGRIKF